MYTYDVAIVGAGMSGLMAARALAEAGRSVYVADKGRSVGGRMATRRLGSGQADHGAQFFTVRDPRFRAFVTGWIETGLVFEWARGWGDGSAHDGHARYAVRGGMNALTRQLQADAEAAGAQIGVNLTVAAVRSLEDGWQLDIRQNNDGESSVVRAGALILTPPVPQSLALLKQGDVVLPDGARLALEMIRYQPCIAVMLRVNGTISLPAPGALQRPEAPIPWIADNNSKGLSPDELLLTMHAGADLSRELYDEADDVIVRAFRVDLQPYLSEGAQIVEAQVKRWRYSQPETPYAGRCLRIDDAAPLVFAGDAFGGPRVEGAALSGLAAADSFIAG